MEKACGERVGRKELQRGSAQPVLPKWSNDAVIAEFS